MIPCAPDGKGTGCTDFGATLTDNDTGIITLQQKDLGYTLQFSQFSIIKSSSLSSPPRATRRRAAARSSSR